MQTIAKRVDFIGIGHLLDLDPTVRFMPPDGVPWVGTDAISVNPNDLSGAEMITLDPRFPLHSHGCAERFATA